MDRLDRQVDMVVLLIGWQGCHIISGKVMLTIWVYYAFLTLSSVMSEHAFCICENKDSHLHG